jgi:hypothetical protein
MNMTVEYVEGAVRQVRKLRREVLLRRDLASDPKEVEWCLAMLDELKRWEKDRVDVLKRVKRGEEIR